MQGGESSCLFKSFLKLYVIAGLFLLSSGSSAVTVNSFELRSLKNGDVIQKSIQGKALTSSKSIKGSESKILINASTERVWNILDKKENLPRIIRQIQEAQVIEDNGSSQKVKTSIKLCRFLPKFDYILSFDRSEKYRRMKFKKTEGCFKDLYGYFEFIPCGNDTILGYRIYSDPGFYIPECITKGLKKDAKKIMIAIKNEAEK